ANREGEIVDGEGDLLGTHQGHHHFTVGQRRGIGLGTPNPLYVLATDAATNRITVGSAEELDVAGVAIRDAVLHRSASRIRSVRLRYRSEPLSCRVGAERGGGAPHPGSHESLRVELDSPARAGAPGQTAVFCDGDLIVGHGTIA
ncbi:MAG: bifunctional Fe-S cluster assembly protein NifU/tRNA 2-thiouridine(34) synthase MnmA, partial [Solirubrobacterales bacterium]|nr:bifunctional Fe-S cluster assembly protein NifU/tRNA 2-thiouridine(34) synthase MnmA [Solirubrobacterales bacterium]